MFEKVSRSLKYDSNFFGPQHNIYISESAVAYLCRVGKHCSTHQYKLPVNFPTNPTSEGSL